MDEYGNDLDLLSADLYWRQPRALLPTKYGRKVLRLREAINMIPPESKAKLEEMALSYAEIHFRNQGHELFGNIVEDFKAGATAAWKMATELAVKAERERILSNLLTRLESYTLDEVDLKTVINPPKDEAEK